MEGNRESRRERKVAPRPVISGGSVDRPDGGGGRPEGWPWGKGRLNRFDPPWPSIPKAFIYKLAEESIHTAAANVIVLSFLTSSSHVCEGLAAKRARFPVFSNVDSGAGCRERSCLHAGAPSLEFLLIFELFRCRKPSPLLPSFCARSRWVIPSSHAPWVLLLLLLLLLVVLLLLLLLLLLLPVMLLLLVKAVDEDWRLSSGCWQHGPRRVLRPRVRPLRVRMTPRRRLESGLSERSAHVILQARQGLGSLLRRAVRAVRVPVVP